MNMIECYKACWVVRGLMEIPDVHLNPDATHAPVASDSSLLVYVSLVVTHNLYVKQLNLNVAFLNSPLTYEV